MGLPCHPGRWLRTAAAVAVLAAAAVGSAAAQTPGDTLVRAAQPDYAQRSGLARSIYGNGWRDLWATPVRVPVLDLAGFAGGLDPRRRGGGRQSITLHMVDAAGDDWIFRSIDKFPEQGVSPEIVGTPIGRIVRDQVSILNPGGHFVMPGLLEAVGVLHVTPTLFVMPDDPALGEHRETFAGMLGEIERGPNEREGDTPGFAGSRKVKGTEEFFEDLEDSAEHRLDEREYLRARLIDFLVGDPDRGSDQWRWARFGEAGAYRWRPIPRDRDWAFIRADGLLARGASKIYPKLIRFEADVSGIETMTYSSHILDRRLLVRLTRQDFEAEAARVKAALTDDVIDRAVSSMPPEYVALRGSMMAAALRARRDELPQAAAEFYAWLAGEVDIRATDNTDLATLERREDGTVLVTIRSHLPRAEAVADSKTIDASAGTPVLFYERVFDPADTREIRVFLHGGADTARVTGVAGGPIRLRVIGGGGDDTLIDEAGGARFYDDRGDNVVVRARGTRLSEKAWQAPLAPEGLRVGENWAPDWGSARGISPTANYEEGTGVTLGVRATAMRYGFRRLPHRWRVDGRALVAAASGALGAEVDIDFRPENSRQRLTLHAAATQIDPFRFHGLGNDTPARTAALTRFRRDVITAEPALEWAIGPLAGRPLEDEENDDDDYPVDVVHGSFRIGPVLRWTRARLPDGIDDDVVTDQGVTMLGGEAVLDLRWTDRERMPRRGFHVTAGAAAYPAVRGNRDNGPFARLGARASGYLPLGGHGTPYIAARAGAEHVSGEFPVWEAAFVGGRHSLRGHSRDRFAGDRSLHGTLELRVPVDTVRLLVRSELGVFGFGDAGRVWYEGESPGGWHAGWGGGMWLSSFGRALSIALAGGERSRLHIWLGLPF